jgi:hypothetical protein
MNIRRIMCLVLVCAMLALCGCEQLPLPSSDGLKVDDVKKITIHRLELDNYGFSIEDRDQIRTIVNQINSFKLENGSAASDRYTYGIRLYGADGSMLMQINIVDEDTVSQSNQNYTVNAKKLLSQVEKLECDTMTDEQLLRILFEGSYFDDVTILNEDGEVSLDKIMSIKNDCPALFELISRPSAIQSLGTYGMDLLDEYLNSEDSELRQKAEEIAEILKNFFPNLKDKINDLQSK